MKRKLSHTDIVRTARKDIDEILTELESMLLPTTLRSNTVANRKSKTPVVSLPNRRNDRVCCSTSFLPIIIMIGIFEVLVHKDLYSLSVMQT